MKKFLKNDTGASAVEYALLVSLIAVAVIIGVMAVGTNVGSVFNSVATHLSNP